MIDRPSRMRCAEAFGIQSGSGFEGFGTQSGSGFEGFGAQSGSGFEAFGIQSRPGKMRRITPESHTSQFLATFPGLVGALGHRDRRVR